MIEPGRKQQLNNFSARGKGKYILYWMQAAQRADYNHALEYAVEKANEYNLPVICVFGLTDKFPDANLRHYYFMLEGLRQVKTNLEERGIKFVICRTEPDLAAIKFAKDAALAVTDDGYLRIQRKWRNLAAAKIDCPLYEVTTNLIVPVKEASIKEEFSAGTLRPRINSKLGIYLRKLNQLTPKIKSNHFDSESFDISDIKKALSKLKIDKTVKPVNTFTGGIGYARKLLRDFIENKLDNFADKRNDPNSGCISNISPYLHFGQISPLHIALEVMKTDSKGKASFLEELIVRRELSHNFVWFNSNYDSFESLPPWAKRTLNFHKKDKRENIYSLEELEAAKTYDKYWNAAQMEMVLTGKMHGYMRMYWGKKIIEWSKIPQQAFKSTLYLNNKYELDGRDPNGFTGAAWCFGKHDRAWQERPIFGKIRYMNSAGLKRKFDADAYAAKIKTLQGKGI